MDKFKVLAFLTLLGIKLSAASLDDPNLTRAFLYLTKFGYNADHQNVYQANSVNITAEGLKEQIISFQDFANLPRTGILDEKTLEMMAKPRCGNKDFVGRGSNARRRKRYALQGSRWKTKDLVYAINNFPKQITEEQTKIDINKAFQIWSDVTDLTFTEFDGTQDKIHIDIYFEKFEHGDGDPFDGPGGTLAHAFFPAFGGDTHFDKSETWTVNSHRGTNLYQVAAHEFGHSLGLSHSDVNTALMAPFYKSYVPELILDMDDIRAIQALYGEKEGEKVPPNEIPDTLSADSAKLCQDASFDAIVRVANEKDCLFKGSEYWVVLRDGLEKGYPRKIADDFKGLPNNIDAAFAWTKGRTYFFKGDSYWRFTNFDPDKGYPKKIAKGFKGIPNNINAAFVWTGNNKIYFFKGTKYWRFEPYRQPPVHPKYPKSISNWEGIPDNIEAAFPYTAQGKTFFFKGGKYWKFDDTIFKVHKTDEYPYPRSVAKWWFSCPEEQVL